MSISLYAYIFSHISRRNFLEMLERMNECTCVYICQYPCIYIHMDACMDISVYIEVSVCTYKYK